jgi:hypothetical protein
MSAPGIPTAKSCPGAWEAFFRKAGVLVPELDGCLSQRARAILIGKFLSPLVGRRVPFEVQGRTGEAELCVTEGRSREKNYFFRVRWETPPLAEPGAKPPAAPAQRLDHNCAPAERGPCTAFATETSPDEGVPATGMQSPGNDEAW